MPTVKNYREKVEDYKAAAKSARKKNRKKRNPSPKPKKEPLYKTKGENLHGKFLTEADTPGPGAEIGMWVDKKFFEPQVTVKTVKKAIIAHFSNPETPMFSNRSNILYGMKPEDVGLSPDSKKWKYWVESHTICYWLHSVDIKEVEKAIWENRWHSFMRNSTDLMYKLYEEGMDGNINAAKEFLNRVLGSPTQQISLTHEAGDSLKALFQKFSAVQAYQRPEVDSDGNEIIELDYSENVGKYYAQENGITQSRRSSEENWEESQEKDQS